MTSKQPPKITTVLPTTSMAPVNYSTIPTETRIIIDGVGYSLLDLSYTMHNGPCPKYSNSDCPHEIMITLNHNDGFHLLDMETKPEVIVIKHILKEHKFYIRSIARDVTITKDKVVIRVLGEVWK